MARPGTEALGRDRVDRGEFKETVNNGQPKTGTCHLPPKGKILVAQSCPTLCDPMDYSPPGSCSWNSPGKNIGVGCHSLLQRIFPTQGSNPGLLQCRQILYHLSHQGSHKGWYVAPGRSVGGRGRGRRKASLIGNQTQAAVRARNPNHQGAAFTRMQSMTVVTDL